MQERKQKKTERINKDVILFLSQINKNIGNISFHLN